MIADAANHGVDHGRDLSGVLVRLIAFLFMAAASVSVGARDFWVGTDTLAYRQAFLDVRRCQCLNATEFEPVFEGMMWIVAAAGGDERAFFVFVATVLAGLLLANAVAVGELVGGREVQRNAGELLALVAVLLWPFYWGGHINILRHGLAALLLSLAFVSLVGGKSIRSVLLAIAAIGVHVTAVVAIPMWLSRWVRPSHLFLLTIALFFAYAVGFTEGMVRVLSEALGLGVYEAVLLYNSWADYDAGVRLDFAIFTLFQSALLWVAISRIRESRLRERALALLVGHCVLSWPFYLFGWANYSNRYAYFAWMYFPVALVAVGLMSVRVRVRGDLLLIGVGVSAFLFAVGARQGIQL